VSASEVRQVAQVSVRDPPKDTDPPPAKGPVVFTVTDELVKDELPMLVKVLVAPEIVLLVKVWEPVRVATVESMATVTVSVGAAVVVIPVPAAMVIVSPLTKDSGVPDVPAKLRVEMPVDDPQPDPVPEITPAELACKH